MKNYPLNLFIFILCCVLCAIVFPLWAGNEENTEVRDLLKKEKIELEKLKINISKQTSALSRIGKKKYSLSCNTIIPAM